MSGQATAVGQSSVIADTRCGAAVADRVSNTCRRSHLPDMVSDMMAVPSQPSCRTGLGNRHVPKTLAPSSVSFILSIPKADPKRRAGGGATMWSPPRCSETAPTPRPRLPPPPMPRRPPTPASSRSPSPRSEGCSPTRPGGPNRPATAARMHSVLSGPPVDSVSVLSQARPAGPIEGLTPSVGRCPVGDRARAGCPRASDEPAGGTAACPSRSRRSAICSGAMTSPADLAAGACQGAVRRGVVRLRAGPRLILARRSPLSGPWG
jgi:hypothetical protein